MVRSRVPGAQRFQMLRGRTRCDVNTLHGKESRIAHGRTVRRFGLALCQLSKIGFIENGKAAQLGKRIG